MFGIDEQWNHELLSFLVVSSTAGSLTRDLSPTREELEPTDGALLLSSPSSLFTALSFASSETRGLCRTALSVSAISVRLFGDDMRKNVLAPQSLWFATNLIIQHWSLKCRYTLFSEYHIVETANEF